jgi:SAM-dependent methyltransferase
MDRTDNTPEALHAALADIGAVNRFLRGSKVLVNAVRPFLTEAQAASPLTVLDVGTGGADVPLALVAEARRLERGIRVVAIDREPATLSYARAQTADVPEIELEKQDALALPYEAASFDIVTASLFLHHFAHDDAVRLLSSFRRIARRAVLINDLERHVVPWAFIALVARITRRHPMFVHDAPLSVLRGFTRDELLAAARDAGDPAATVRAFHPFRLLLKMTECGAAG